MTYENRAKIIIVDDHPVMRWGFGQILSTLAPDLQLVGDFATASDALEWLAGAEADIAVVDIGLEGRSGLELLKRLVEEFPAIKVLLYSRHHARDFALQGMKLGAAGFLSKNATPEKIVDALRAIVMDGRYITPETAAVLHTAIARNGNALPPHASLSARQSEVFRALLAGESVTGIARKLNLSVKTVSTHRTQLLSRLDLRSTADLFRYALAHGIDE